MKVLLLQLDGKLPNLALMRIAAHHRARGDEVTLRRPMNKRAPTLSAEHIGQATLGEPENWGAVYASAIFSRSLPLVERVRSVYRNAAVGGTGVDEKLSLEAIGITSTTVSRADGFIRLGIIGKTRLDYSLASSGSLLTASDLARSWSTS